MAATAYALSAIILVFYFGDLAGFQVNPSEYKADAATYQKVSGESEETITSDTLSAGNKEYTLNGPDNHILLEDITETVDQLPEDKTKRVSYGVYPLGQLSISQPAISLDSVAASMAILTSQQYMILTDEAVNERLELFAMTVAQASETSSKVMVDTSESSQSAGTSSANTTQNVTKESESTKKNEEEAKEVNAKSELAIPASLSLKTNKNMIKTLSADELEVLYRIVEAEATGEDVYGKILVANVVLNRVNCDEFPDTVSEVVFQKVGSAYQFSPTKDGRYYTVKISKSTKEAVSRALAGEDYSDGALYFFARKLTSQKKASWFDQSLRKVVQYGCHEFYANK